MSYQTTMIIRETTPLGAKQVAKEEALLEIRGAIEIISPDQSREI